ncbi:MAG TPA: hypothetical protein VHB25_21440 [Gemmatimonadaceae bacterium]|nr:hypothetical protein [Gemmatimonadaceae bacterium]
MKAFKAALLALVAVAAACSEGNVVAPNTQAPTGPAAVGGGSSQSLYAIDTARFSFVIDPARNLTYDLGAGNTITFPAHSLCDPKSPYGMGQWDKPCTVARAPLTVNALAWIDGSGHPRVDFDKEIRFVPTDRPSGWVILSFTDYAAAQGWLNILYCPNAKSNGCIDESKKDPTLVTFRDPVTGKLTRRIKHFSGYNLGAGDDSSGTVGGGMDRASLFAPSFGRGGKGPSNTSVDGVLFTQSVGAGHTASAVIGPFGGVLNLKATGLTLVVPPGAVSHQTTISVTAVPGRIIAYDFEPHGTRFNVPLLFVQDLRKAVHGPLKGLRLHGAYFADDSQLDDSDGSAVVDEVLSAAVDPFTGAAVFPIWHFSGYMLAMG